MRHNGLLKWRSHTDYEQLCAKVAYGGAEDAEFVDLVQHLCECADCRTMLLDLTRIIANILPQIAERSGTQLLSIGHSGQRNTMDNGSLPSANLISALRRRRWPLILTWCAPVFVCAALIASYVRLQEHELAPSAATPEITSPHVGENGQAREPAPTVATGPDQRQQLQAALARIGKLESALKTANQATADREKENAQLLARVDADERSMAETSRVAQEQGQEITRLQQQVVEKDAALKSKDAELGNINGRLAETTAQLGRQREITKSLTKVQELIAARDFHVIDVLPMQAVKSRAPAFGRILYAEGRELMFYGYDLAGASELANATFHVWGDRIGTNVLTSLGVFTSDDMTDSRWRLILANVDALAHVDRILVTAESTAHTITKPKGKTILIAYMGGQPNHP